MNTFKHKMKKYANNRPLPPSVKEKTEDTLAHLPDYPAPLPVHRYTWRGAAVLASVLLLCCLFVSVTPSFASRFPVLQSIFSLVEKHTIYSGSYRHATPLSPGKNSRLSVSSGGVRLSAFEVCFDGFSAYITLRAQADEAVFSDAPVCMKTQFGFNRDAGKEDYDIILDGKAENNRTYAGIMKLDRSDITKEGGFVKIHITRLYLENDTEISGKWDLTIPYSAPSDSCQEVYVGEKVNSHLTIEKIFLSPYQIVVFSREKTSDTSQIALFDQDGQPVSFEEIGDGSGPLNRSLYARKGKNISKLYIYTADGSSPHRMDLLNAKTRKKAKLYCESSFSIDIP